MVVIFLVIVGVIGALITIYGLAVLRHREKRQVVEIVDSCDLFKRGMIDTRRGDYDRAIADFSKTLELNPKLALAMASMGRAYQLKGNKGRAKIWYARALQSRKQLSVEEAGLVRKRLEALKVRDEGKLATFILRPCQGSDTPPLLPVALFVKKV